MKQHQRIAAFKGARIELQGGGYITADLVIEVDARALMRGYGRRAMLNKSGAAKVARGAVVVRATKLAREEGAPWPA